MHEISIEINTSGQWMCARTELLPQDERNKTDRLSNEGDGSTSTDLFKASTGDVTQAATCFIGLGRHPPSDRTSKDLEQSALIRSELAGFDAACVDRGNP